MADNDALRCPGCHTPFPPEATGCQICMRARSKQEIMRGYAKLREDKARKRRRPFHILAALLILGAGGKFLVVYGDKLKTAAVSAGGAIGRWADDMRNPSNYAMRSPAVPVPAPAAPAVPGAPVAPEDALRTQLFAPDSPPEQGSTPAPAEARPSATKPLAKNAWRVSGSVYDLVTLKPVQGAAIAFLRDEKGPAAVTTDERGAYAIDLVKGDGWTVSLEAQGYRRGQIIDIDPSYRVRDADERRAVLEHISDGDLIAAPVGWKRASTKVSLDLLAVPNRWTDVRPR